MKFLAGPLLAAALAAASIAAQAATGITITAQDLRGSDDRPPAVQVLDEPGTPVVGIDDMPEVREPPWTWQYSPRIVVGPRTRITVTVPVRTRWPIELWAKMVQGSKVYGFNDLGAKQITFTFTNNSDAQAIVGYHWRQIVWEGKPED